MQQHDQQGEVATPSFKLATIVTLTLITLASMVSCSEEPQSKEVGRIPGHIIRDTPLVIREVRPSGAVGLGQPKSPIKIFTDPHFRKVFMLEGMGAVGDSVVIAYAYDDILYESGAVKRVITGVKVVSERNEHWHEYFAKAKEEGKPPGTQTNQ